MKKLSLKGFFLYLFLPLLPLIVFWFIPMIASFFISLTNWDYISPNFQIVGVQNYQGILGDKAFYSALKNTLVFGLGTVLPTLALGFSLALLLDRERQKKAGYQAFLFAPWITPMVAMSIVWSWMYRPEGLINAFLGTKIHWLTDSKTAMVALVVVTIWKNAGWAMLFYADALSKIPESLKEVGYLEGASSFQKICHILLPMTSGTTLFLGIVSLIDSIQAYDQINVLTQGGPAGSTRTLLYLYYQMAFEQFNMGKATALSLLIVLICGVLALTMAFLQKRFQQEV